MLGAWGRGCSQGFGLPRFVKKFMNLNFLEFGDSWLCGIIMLMAQKGCCGCWAGLLSFHGLWIVADAGLTL